MFGSETASELKLKVISRPSSRPCAVSQPSPATSFFQFKEVKCETSLTFGSLKQTARFAAFYPSPTSVAPDSQVNLHQLWPSVLPSLLAAIPT